MSWHAKPKGAYAIGSDECNDNCIEIYNILSSTWTLEAICGFLGNVWAESQMNPWRWQDDEVSLTSDYKGYGLVQFTPAYGYIYDYGVDVDYYAPNLSVDETTDGALATDGIAQLTVVDQDLAGKFLNRTSYCDYYDISGYYPMSSFRQASDLYGATVAWLFHYEFPADRSSSVASVRYSYAQSIYSVLQNYIGSGGSGGDSDDDDDDDDSGGASSGTGTFKKSTGKSVFYKRLKIRVI